MRAWLFQDHRQKRSRGARAPWSVGWIDQEGIRRSKRIGSKSMALKFARKKEGQLAAGTCESVTPKLWHEFRMVICQGFYNYIDTCCPLAVWSGRRSYLPVYQSDPVLEQCQRSCQL